MSQSRDAILKAYHGYLACLNARDWAALPRFVTTDVIRNGAPLGLTGYRALLEGDVRAIPDLAFEPSHLVCDPPLIAARLVFDCTPVGMLMGLPVNGRRVRFTENVLYEYRDGRIAQVWSVIDRTALEAQL